MTEETKPAPAKEVPEFAILRIYLKDVSFETPNSPGAFAKDPEAEIGLHLNINSKSIEKNIYEVVLAITVTSKQGDQTAFLVEVQQAGLFLVKGVDESKRGNLLGTHCPTILFPFAREVISGLVTKGGFPDLQLAPISFDAMYAEGLAQQKANQASSAK